MQVGEQRKKKVRKSGQFVFQQHNCSETSGKANSLILEKKLLEASEDLSLGSKFSFQQDNQPEHPG